MLGLCAIKFQHVAFLAIDSVVCSKFANLHQNKQIEGIFFAWQNYQLFFAFPLTPLKHLADSKVSETYFDINLFYHQ